VIQEGEIKFDDINEKKFPAESLLDLLNQWANPQKFKLIRSEGIKFNSTAFSQTLICSKRSCKFR